MDAYGGFADLQQAFVDFANKVPFYGAVVACADDAELCRVIAALHAARDHLRHRGSTRANVTRQFVERATDVTLEGFGSRCTVVRAQPPRRRHRDHARHADACGAGPPLGAERARARSRSASSSTCRSIASRRRSRSFSGAERRFERRGVIDGITVVDDYGHHPTEIAAVLAAARAAQARRASSWRSSRIATRARAT